MCFTTLQRAVEVAHSFDYSYAINGLPLGNSTPHPPVVRCLVVRGSRGRRSRYAGGREMHAHTGARDKEGQAPAGCWVLGFCVSGECPNAAIIRLSRCQTKPPGGRVPDLSTQRTGASAWLDHARAPGGCPRAPLGCAWKTPGMAHYVGGGCGVQNTDLGHLAAHWADRASQRRPPVDNQP